MTRGRRRGAARTRRPAPDADRAVRTAQSLPATPGGRCRPTRPPRPRARTAVQQIPAYGRADADAGIDDASDASMDCGSAARGLVGSAGQTATVVTGAPARGRTSSP